MEAFTVEHIVALNSKINEARLTEKYCDVTIKVGEKVFKCHRLILSSASEYFDSMFSCPFKESKSDVIELNEEVATAEDVLHFIYTGEVVVTDSNVFNLMLASQYYNLPGLRKCCHQFIEDKMKMEVIFKDALKVLTFIHTIKFKDVWDACITSLSMYIRKHLHYFVNSSYFLDLNLDNLKEILEQFGPSKNENVALQAIIRWVQQSNESEGVEGARLNSVLDTVHFENVSPEYMKYAMKQSLIAMRHRPFDVSRQNDKDGSDKNEEVSTAEESTQISVVDAIPQSLHVYTKDIVKKVTNVFTLQKCSMGFDWFMLCQANGYSDMMRVASLNDRLYCLNYNKPMSGPSDFHQTFSVSSAVSLFPDSSLKPPPLVVAQFDICGMNNCIYMYNKNNLSNVVQSVEDCGFDDESISRGVYGYNCEIDKWFPLPPLQQKLNKACMTCDDRRGLIYLIGGKNSRQPRYDGHVQVYDPRSEGWMEITRSNDFHVNGACCFSDHYREIYVSGGISRPKQLECYDIVAQQWRTFGEEMNAATNSRHLIAHEKNIWAFGRNLTKLSVEVFGTGAGSWLSISSLFEAAEDSKSADLFDFPVQDVVADCVTFKPFGL